MAQLSRRPLSKKVYFSIFDSFHWLFKTLNKNDDAKVFLNDFLSRSEKLMLAKRLAIALLLSKHFTYNDIRQILHVSPSTIYKVQQLLDNSTGYQLAIKKLAKKEQLDIFWKEIIKIAHVIGKGKKIFG